VKKKKKDKQKGGNRGAKKGGQMLIRSVTEGVLLLPYKTLGGREPREERGEGHESWRGSKRMGRIGLEVKRICAKYVIQGEDTQKNQGEDAGSESREDAQGKSIQKSKGEERREEYEGKGNRDQKTFLANPLKGGLQKKGEQSGRKRSEENWEGKKFTVDFIGDASMDRGVIVRQEMKGEKRGGVKIY